MRGVSIANLSVLRMSTPDGLIVDGRQDRLAYFFKGKGTMARYLHLSFIAEEGRSHSTEGSHRTTDIIPAPYKLLKHGYQSIRLRRRKDTKGGLHYCSCW